jgi:hypothetical protein
MVLVDAVHPEDAKQRAVPFGEPPRLVDRQPDQASRVPSLPAQRDIGLRPEYVFGVVEAARAAYLDGAGACRCPCRRAVRATRGAAAGEGCTDSEGHQGRDQVSPHTASFTCDGRAPAGRDSYVRPKSPQQLWWFYGPGIAVGLGIAIVTGAEERLGLVALGLGLALVNAALLWMRLRQR